MIRNALADAKVNAILGKGVVGVCALIAVAGLVLGGRGIYCSFQRSQAVDAAKADQEAIRQALETLDKSRSIEVGGQVEGLAAVNAFQRYFIDQATRSGCTVREVVASSEGQPYVTKFNKDTPANAYVQLGFKASLNGTPSQVLATIQSLVDSPVPWEMDGATLRRSTVKHGGSVLEFAIELRVLATGGAA